MLTAPAFYSNQLKNSAPGIWPCSPQNCPCFFFTNVGGQVLGGIARSIGGPASKGFALSTRRHSFGPTATMPTVRPASFKIGATRGPGFGWANHSEVPYIRIASPESEGKSVESWLRPKGEAVHARNVRQALCHVLLRAFSADIGLGEKHCCATQNWRAS
jgi:hypothetical protein